MNTNEITREPLGYWPWVYYITRLWDYPDDVEAKVIGFAIILSTFGKDGHNIWPAAHTVARRAGMTKKTARRYRQRCIDLGLFRDTGQRVNYIPVLEISIPDGGTVDAEIIDDDLVGFRQGEPVSGERRSLEPELTGAPACEPDAETIRRMWDEY